MAITFNEISSTNRVPGPQIEVDGSQSRTTTREPHHVLLIGTRLSTGTATEGQIKSIVGKLDGDAYFGSKSQLGQMCRAFKRINRTAKCSAMALDEDSGGTAASGSFALTGPATADGTLRVRIGDQRISISVTSGDTATQIGVALDAAIDATERCLFSATNSTGTVTITCRHKGEVGNHVTIDDELLPAGIACTLTQPTSGATDPDLDDAIAAMADERYDTIVVGYTVSANFAKMEAEALRRWGPTVKQTCHVFAGVRGSHGTLTSYGSARNSRVSTIIGSGTSPTPPWIWAAQAAARDAQRCDTQPNRPRNGMVLTDCEAPEVTSRFDLEERNLLLFDGISTFKVDAAGTVMIERLITTYQTDANSLADATYLSIETVRNLAALYQSALQLAGKYGDYLVAEDGTQVDPGVPLLTPGEWKGELKAWSERQERAGLLKDSAGFAEDLLAEINADDGERIDTELAPRLVKGLVTMAMKMAFQ